MQFFEMIAIEIVEKTAAPNRVLGDLRVVNLPVPVVADLLDSDHRSDYKARIGS